MLHAWPAFENDFLAFITYDDEHHRLAFVNTPGAADPAPGTAGVDHFAYTYAILDDLVHTYERLKGEGINPVWTINHGPTTSLYYQAPNGHRVELQIDNFETTKALNAWFRSPALPRTRSAWSSIRSCSSRGIGKACVGKTSRIGTSSPLRPRFSVDK